MGDKIEMSLDEIIKTSNIGNFRRGGTKAGGRPAQRNRTNGAIGGGGGFRNNQGGRQQGGVLKGRNRNAPQRAKFSRVRRCYTASQTK